MKSRHIQLSDQERTLLESLRKTSNQSRVRDRCHALILSDKGFNIKQLSKVFSVGRDTIGIWLDRWEEFGAEGLEDLPKSGRPSVFSPSDKKNY